MVNKRIDELKDIMYQLGVDLNTIVFGKGCKRTVGRDGRKNRYYVTSDKITKGIRFVIQYAKDIDQYIAWKVQDSTKMRNLSVIADDIPIVEGSSVRMIVKGKEFVFRDKVAVYTFGSSGSEEFIKKYILR